MSIHNLKYEIRDTIYGFIPFNEWEKEIIDTFAFQRLRRIRQLALTEMVYPGAAYSRFEHSLGVMHMASQMFDSIVNNKRNKDILKDELRYNDSGIERVKQIIRLAALLHDIGHAPFSHASENLMPKNSKTDHYYQHEDYSTAIIKGPLMDIIENHPMNENNFQIKAEDIAAVLEGNLKILKKNIFWKILISSQLDADRSDYLLRDSFHAGVKYGIYDYQRLLNTLVIGLDPESNEIILGVNQGGWHIAEAIIIARYQMFTQVYFHKTRRAYDYHLNNALKVLLPNGLLPGPDKIDDFLELDDIAILNKAKEKLNNPDCKALLERNHLRMVFYTPEVPTKDDEDEFIEKETILKNNKIWYYIDNSKQAWYKMNDKKDDNREIMIVDTDKNKLHPLSDFSRVAKNMGAINQKRLYVKPEDKNKTREILHGRPR